MRDNSIKSFIVGKYKSEYNSILNKSIKVQEIYQSKGLIKHIEKRHPDCIQYASLIPEILLNPDYIGVNPNEKGESIELVKKFDKNILIGIKLDKDDNHLYVSTLFEIHQSKVDKRIASERLKKYKNE